MMLIHSRPAALALCLMAVGTGNFYGAGGFAPYMKVLDWAYSGQGNAEGLGPPGTAVPTGKVFNFRYQSHLVAAADWSGNPAFFAGLNEAYEYTITMQVPMQIASSDGTASVYRTRPGGRFYIWHDAPINARPDSGFGFSDGTLVAGGSIDPDQSLIMVGAFGSMALVGRVGFKNGGYLVPTRAMSRIQTTATLELLSSGSAPKMFFFGRPLGIPGLFGAPPYFAGDNDLSFRVDGNSAFLTNCTGTIGDFVWHDLNRDGLQGVNEPGIDGVKVNLRLRLSPNDAAGIPIATAITGPGPWNRHGFYQFAGLCAGDYTVSVGLSTLPLLRVQPPESTVVNAGSNRAVDSNGTPASVRVPTDISTDRTVDFGFRTVKIY